MDTTTPAFGMGDRFAASCYWVGKKIILAALFVASTVGVLVGMYACAALHPEWGKNGEYGAILEFLAGSFAWTFHFAWVIGVILAWRWSRQPGFFLEHLENTNAILQHLDNDWRRQAMAGVETPTRHDVLILEYRALLCRWGQGLGVFPPMRTLNLLALRSNIARKICQQEEKRRRDIEWRGVGKYLLDAGGQYRTWFRATVDGDSR